MGRDDILRRIARVVGEPALAAIEALAPRDLASLLLHLFERRAAEVGPVDALARAADGLFSPSFADPRESLAFLEEAFAAAGAFESVELSPVCPLGTTRALGGIHQNNVLSASRGAELLADPTPAIALLAAQRRRADRARTVRLCASARVVRMQPAPPGLLPHFRLFALQTAGARGEEGAWLCQQLRVWLTLLTSLSGRGHRFADITVDVSHTAAMQARLVAAGASADELRRRVRTQVFADADALAASFGISVLRGRAAEVLPSSGLARGLAAAIEELDRDVVAPLAAEHPEARVRIDLSRLEGIGYYTGACVRISARDPSGAMLPLVDGGFTDWSQRLLSDGRERLLSTGIGADLVTARFRS
jgi:hypothetical protein